MNETLKNAGKEILKDLLSKCSEPQQLMFKRMYCHKNLALPINEAVDQMADDKIDWAITQCEKTVSDNAKKLADLK
jgi:hypothetical protein